MRVIPDVGYASSGLPSAQLEAFRSPTRAAFVPAEICYSIVVSAAGKGTSSKVRQDRERSVR
jgi:hypothetical protein